MPALATTILPGCNPPSTASLAARWITVIAFAILSLIPCLAARAQDCLWPTWTQVADNPELARFEHAMAYDAARQQVVMFGGRLAPGNVMSDTAIWDGKRWTQLNVVGPSPRADHAMAYDPVRQRVVLTGGTDGEVSNLRDTWEWDGQSWTLVSTDGPVARGPVMDYDPVGQRTLVANHLGELWAWDGTLWTLLATDGPTQRHAAVAFDQQREVLVVTGGQGGGAGSLGSTAEWSPALGWRGFGLNGFPFNQLVHHAAFYSAAKRGVMMFGGSDLTGFFSGGITVTLRSGTFIWDGSRWATWGNTSLFGQQAWHRQDHAAVGLPGGSALVFGGRTVAGSKSDTLVLSFVPATPEPLFSWTGVSAFPTFALGSTIHVQAHTSDAGQWWFLVGDRGSRYTWEHNGKPLSDGPWAGGIVANSTTSVLQVFNARLAHGGLYGASVVTCSGKLDIGGAALSVLCAANLTTTANPSSYGYGIPDAALNSEDFFYYLLAFAAGNTAVADLTTTGATAPGQAGWLIPDGQITNDDFFAYLFLYTSGC